MRASSMLSSRTTRVDRLKNVEEGSLAFRHGATLVLLLCLGGSLGAQQGAQDIAPSRTWPELRQAVQERADRNAYPLTGMKAEDVREILGHIGSLDRDEWAAAWSR